MKFKFEFIIFIITAGLIMNTYHDGKYFKMVETANARKYIKMATFGFFGLSMYLFLKKNPANSQTIMHHANELIKYMPISRESADMLTPFFDMTNKRAFFNGNNGNNGNDDEAEDWSNASKRQQYNINKMFLYDISKTPEPFNNHRHINQFENLTIIKFDTFDELPKAPASSNTRFHEPVLNPNDRSMEPTKCFWMTSLKQRNH